MLQPTFIAAGLPWFRLLVFLPNELTQQQPPYNPYQPPGDRRHPSGYTNDELTWSMLCHLSTLAQFIVPLGSILGPLLCWLIKRNESPYIDANGKEAVNFNLTVLLYGVILAVVTVPPLFIFSLIPFVGALVAIFGVFFAMLVWLVPIVLSIIAAVRANNGELYRYPLTIRFIR